ncbi:MAG: ABC transporter ATP-binding protein, partial [Mailhella sp.]|nr:ABC transporter ATP-binding protein [Mailhella sp.]
MPADSDQDVAAQKEKMSLAGMLKSILPFVVPYKRLVAAALVLTFAGSVLAQVNAVVLDKTVDAINALVSADSFSWGQAAAILIAVSSVLLGKELCAAVVTFFQRYCGEQMRILVRRDLAFRAVGKLLSFRLAYYAAKDNETGKVQARIDRGLMSLSRTVSNFFIEILPLFTSAVLALGLMFAANVYVGLVALCIVPIYFYLTYVQAKYLKGWRRNIFGSHQAVSQGILNII